MERYTNSYKVNRINIKITRILPGIFVAADEGEATEAAVAASAANAVTAAVFPLFLAEPSAILERLFPSVSSEVGIAAEAAACPPPLLVVGRVRMGDLMAEKEVARAAAGARQRQCQSDCVNRS